MIQSVSCSGVDADAAGAGAAQAGAGWSTQRVEISEDLHRQDNAHTFAYQIDNVFQAQDCTQPKVS